MELLVGEGAHGGDGDPQFFEIGGAAVASLQMLLESLPCGGVLRCVKVGGDELDQFLALR